MTIAVFGADGQLGRDLLDTLAPHNPVPFDLPDADITDRRTVMRLLAEHRPDWVVNSAAMTHVDRCESEHEQAMRVNAIGAGHLADACAEFGARLVHISTDYVFDGLKSGPYVETDTPRPINVYGISKFAGELYVRRALDAHYIVRSSGLYGTHPCRGKDGRNFVDTMLALAEQHDELKVVVDEVLTPTFTLDLARQIARMIDAVPPPGIYHATNDGECSWHEFAKEIFEQAGRNVRVAKTTSAEWGAPARRPANSVLANAALDAAGLDIMPPWRDALSRYLAAKAKK